MFCCDLGNGWYISPWFCTATLYTCIPETTQAIEMTFWMKHPPYAGRIPLPVATTIVRLLPKYDVLAINNKLVKLDSSILI